MNQTINLRKYFALIRAGILDQLQYRVATLVLIIGNLIYLTIAYFLWKAIFASSESGVVAGMTFETTLIYLVLATALFNFMQMYAVWEVGRNIQTGKIVLELLRPFEYRRYLFWSLSGALVVQFVTTFLPTFIAVLIVTKNSIPLGINLLYFGLSVMLGVVINYCIEFIVGTVCIYTESIWGINIMKEVIVLLFSGATIPLAFFPDTIKKVTLCLPFRAIYDSPLRLLLNANPDLLEVGKILGIQLAWAIGLTVFSKVFWDLSIKKITVNGG